MTDATYERGVQIRHEMSGKDVTDAQPASADEVTSLIQDLVTRYRFGEVRGRGRELLSRKVRSMLAIAMLALGRDNEIRAHIRGALNNGVSKEEIDEVLLHAATYAGVPAGGSGFRCAREVFAQLDAKAGAPS